MFDLYENVVDLAASKKTGGGAALPFGEETTVKEVLAECQPEYVPEIEEGLSGFVVYATRPDTVVLGETYIVNYNGVDYPCVATGKATREVVDPADSVVILGNLGAATGGTDTGEPFAISWGVSQMFIVPLDGSTTLTISIRQEVTEVKKISGKYVEGMGYSEGDTVTWDGNNDGHYALGMMYKVSDLTPAADAIMGAKFKQTFVPDSGAWENEGVVTNVLNMTDWLYQVRGEFNDGTGDARIGLIALSSGEVEGMAVEPGIYFFNNGEDEYCSYLSWETIHPIDPKFLPSGGGGAVYYADEIGALFHDSSFTTPVSFEEARDAVDIIIRMVWNSETIDFYPAFKHVIPGQETVRFHCLDYNDSGNPVFKQYFAGVTAG